MYDTYSSLVRSRVAAPKIINGHTARRMHLALRFVTTYHEYCQAGIGEEAISTLGDMVFCLTALLDREPWPTDRAESRSFMAHWASCAASLYTGVDALPVRNACRWTNNLLWLNDYDLDDAIAHNTRKIA